MRRYSEDKPDAAAAPGSGAQAPPTKAQAARVPHGPASESHWTRAQAEARLVGRVFERCQAEIAEVSKTSSVPPQFLGALTANESAGASGAARFEPAVYRHLAGVAAGASAVYANLRAPEIHRAIDREIQDTLHPKAAEFHARYLTAPFQARSAQEIASLGDEVLRELSTSWGFTQIMGYHVLGRGARVRDLLDPAYHYRLAVELLAEFAHDYALDPGSEFEEMFRCWNTGQPYGKTYDPAYVANGLGRMGLYARFAAQAMSPPVDGG
jgi:hypothetical protein